jgi:4-hydroxy-tetrahydrodipicolinate synthase
MFKGSCVALVTPLTATGEIDEKSVISLTEWHIEQGTAALVVMGTTGESATMTLDEQKQMISLVKKVANKRIPVIAGTGTNSTATTITKCQMAAEMGVDGCLIVTPYYNRPTQNGLYEHFSLIARNTNLPILLYNVPTRTACDMQPETVAKLSTISNIVGIKEATGNLERLKALKAQCSADFLYYSGDDPTAREFILQGGHGVISITANVAPKQMQQMCLEAIKGENASSQALDERLQALHKMLIIEPNPIPVKWALHYLEKIPNGIRLPLTPFSNQYHQQMVQALALAQVQ